MIDFRYHIVSIIAVFLALGLGVLMGTTVADRVTAAALESRVNDLSSRLSNARQEIADLRGERDTTTSLLRTLSPWAVRGKLADRGIVLVSNGELPRWQQAIRQQLADAGATILGSIILTDKWELTAEGGQEELELVVGSVTPAFDAGEDAATAALGLLGERLLEPTGRALLAELASARFVTVDMVQEAADWPPAGTALAVLSAHYDEESPEPAWLAALARGAAAVTSIVVASAEPEGFDAVDVLRQEDDQPPSLSTFDSAEADPTAAGVALSLEAATRDQGGHFGAASGLRYLPAPGPAATPAPAGP